MEKAHKDVYVDVNTSGISGVVYVRKGDASSRLLIVHTNYDGTPFFVSDDLSINARAMLPSDEIVNIIAYPIHGNIAIEIDDIITSIKGNVLIQSRISDGNSILNIPMVFVHID